MSGRRLVELRYALGSNLDPLRMEIFDDGIVDCGEHAAQFVFVFFEERDAESLQVRAETRTRNHADSLCAQEVIDKAVVEVCRLAAPFFDFLLDNRIVDFERLVAVEHAFAEDDGVVERTVCRVEIQFRDVRKDFVDDGATAANLLVKCGAVLDKARIAQHARNCHLRERGRADFHHLCVVDGAAESVELFVLVAVVVFGPAATSARPRVFLGNALERDARHVADVFGESVGVGAIVRNLVVDFVADDEQVVTLRDIHDFLEDVERVDHAGRVVRVQDEDARDARVVLHLVFKFFQVRVPVVLGLETVGDGGRVGMCRFGGTVGAVSRSRSDDAGVHREQAVDGGDGVTEAVEEQNVVDVDLCAAELVVFLDQEFAGLEHALGGAVAVAAVRLDEVDHDVLDPVGNLALLFNRVADVFPVDGEAECLELVCLLHDLADFVREFLGTFAQ